MIQIALRVSFVFLILVSGWASNAQSPIHVKFIGNCGLYLTDGSTNIYVDFPYKPGAFGYMKYNLLQLDSIKNNSIFIFTHKHADHYSKKLLKSVLDKKEGLTFTQGKSKKLIKHLESIPDIQVEVFKTKHRFTFKHNSYLITWHGKRIFLSGDTESSDTIVSLKEMDWAFVPPWILENAKEKNAHIDAKEIGIYHYYPSEIEEAIKEWKGKSNITPLTQEGTQIVIE